MTPCRWNEQWTRNGVTVVRCETCGFIHQIPFPPAAHSTRLYHEGYYEEMKPDYSRIVQEDAGHFAFWAREKMEQAEALLSAGGTHIPGRVLDVGASFGQFLRHWAAAGWQCAGIEPSSLAAAQAAQIPGVHVVNALLEDTSPHTLGGPFHVVHMGEVLNHMRSPREALTLIHDAFMASGGVLIIETSNDFSQLQYAALQQTRQAVRQQDMWWITPDHVSYFSMDSLCALLEKCGFRIAVRDATFPMELFIMQGDNYLDAPQTGRQCHKRRVAADLNLGRGPQGGLRRTLYRALAEQGAGRSLLVYAVKGTTE
jgi:2-polyprenyl-3-methyl-5-hydroxy-6-metoxy-1,4-benzoquinol methylase